jgi:hypothetical protein
MSNATKNGRAHFPANTGAVTSPSVAMHICQKMVEGIAEILLGPGSTAWSHHHQSQLVDEQASTQSLPQWSNFPLSSNQLRKA